MQIHINKDGGQLGPFSPEQVHSMLAFGQLNGQEQAWREGLTDWQPLSTVVSVPARSAAPVSFDPYSPPMTADRPVIRADAGGPTGIGGWLLFYCICLTILGPLGVAFQAVKTIAAIEILKGKFPDVVTALYAETGGVVVLALYGLVVGVMLWTKNPSALRMVKVFLIARLVAFLALEATVLYMMRNLTSEILDEAVSGVIVACGRIVVGFLIWWFYFQKSKRVANTFPAGAE